jgi:hypothetical protein
LPKIQKAKNEMLMRFILERTPHKKRVLVGKSEFSHREMLCILNGVKNELCPSNITKRSDKMKLKRLCLVSF